ncbi:MAG: VWA domain-containing protein [Thermoleophilaceae bacterium]|nr:VWA domain-containing protein [Thermoleophilaceae bacterium]
MSFASPGFLALLLLLPLAALAYLRIERGRRRQAEAFAAPGMLASVAPRRPGWRRHAPMWLYGIAIAVLAVALARPQATVAVPVERASVVLAIDESGSMEARDVRPSRLAAARRAAGDFLDDVPRRVRVGAVIFNHHVRSAEAPTTDRAEVEASIAGLRSSGGTATGDALDSSLRLIAATDGDDRRPPPAAIVLLSDGESTHGRDPVPVARLAAKRKIPIYTVALGTDTGTIQVQRPDGSRTTERVPPDRDTMRQIARISSGRYYEAADAPELSAVYERLGSQVSTRPEEREITAAFAAGAVLLMMGGGAASLRWFGRLP